MIIRKYYHITKRVLNLITKLMSDIFKDQQEAVVIVKLPNIWYLWKALNVLCIGYPEESYRNRSHLQVFQIIFKFSSHLQANSK